MRQWPPLFDALLANEAFHSFFCASPQSAILIGTRSFRSRTVNIGEQRGHAECINLDFALNGGYPRQNGSFLYRHNEWSCASGACAGRAFARSPYDANMNLFIDQCPTQLAPLKCRTPRKRMHSHGRRLVGRHCQTMPSALGREHVDSRGDAYERCLARLWPSTQCSESVLVPLLACRLGAEGSEQALCISVDPTNLVVPCAFSQLSAFRPSAPSRQPSHRQSLVPWRRSNGLHLWWECIH